MSHQTRHRDNQRRTSPVHNVNGGYPQGQKDYQQISSSQQAYMPNSMNRSKSPVYNVNAAQAKQIKIDSKPAVDHTQASFNPNTQLYNLNFKVFHQTIPGESVCVLGSIPELGSWKTLKCHMTWTEGHIWQMSEPVITGQPFFSYKYVLMDNDKTTMVRWESGVDRIADLRLLPQMSQQAIKMQQALTQETKMKHAEELTDFRMPQTNLPIKYVEMNDEFESYLVKFTVFWPLEHEAERLSMQTDRTGVQVMQMERIRDISSWMNSKYGMSMRPWECIIKVPNTESGQEGQFDELSQRSINYSYQSFANGKAIKERDPQRVLTLQNPKQYKGEFGSKGTDEQYFNDRSYIVNGMINKADGNFLRGFFINEIANSGIIIGPYPLYETDVNQIAATGANAVLNLQTPLEIQQRGADVNEIDTWYRSKGIKQIVNYPVDDTNEQNLNRTLFGACEKLNQLMADGKTKVYVHCTSSVTRSTTLVNCYLCLYIKAVDWQSPMAVQNLIKHYHNASFPNIRAINQVVKANKHIQDAEFTKIRAQQLDYLLNERQRIQIYHDNEEARLLAQLRSLEDDEAEKIRLLQLWEAQNLYYEHFADGEVDLNMLSETDLDTKCDDLFNSTPIPFVVKKGENHVLEKEIQRLITQLNLTIPIIHVKGQVYLIGTQKQIIQCRGDQIMVRVGGGYVQFDEYIPNNHRFFERTLLVHMIKSQESLEWVCDALMKDKKIQHSNKYEYNLNQGQRTSASNLVINRRLAVSRSDIQFNQKQSSPNRFSPTRSPVRSPVRNSASPKKLASPTRKSISIKMAQPSPVTGPNRSSFGYKEASSPNRFSSNKKMSPSPYKNSSPRSRKSNSKSPSKRNSVASTTPTSSAHGKRLNKDLHTSTSLPDFHPQKYGSVMAYKESQEHHMYLTNKDQVMKALNQNKVASQQNLGKINSQIEQVKKDRKIIVNPNMPMVYKDAPKWEYNPKYKENVLQNQFGTPEQKGYIDFNQL